MLGTGIHWAAIFTSTGVVLAGVGVIIGVLQLRHARRAHQDQTAVELWRRWDEPALVDIRQQIAVFDKVEEFCAAFRAHRERNDKAYYAWLAEPNFLEDLAVLEEERAVSFGFLRKSLGGLLVKRWGYWRLCIEEMRVLAQRDQIYENFERLAGKMARALDLPFDPISSVRDRLDGP